MGLYNNHGNDPGSRIAAQEELQLPNSSNNKLFFVTNNNSSSNNNKIFYVISNNNKLFYNISNNNKLCSINKLFCIINSNKLDSKNAMTKVAEGDIPVNNNLACNGHRKENRI